MKKWDEQQRQKNYALKIKNARSKLLIQKHNNYTTTSNNYHIQQQLTPQQQEFKSNKYISQRVYTLADNPHSCRDNDYSQTPLYKLLKLFGLQQYAKELVIRNFGYDLTKFSKLAPIQLQSLIEDMNMIPGHKTKFENLLLYIESQILPDLYQKDYAIDENTDFNIPISNQGAKTQCDFFTNSSSSNTQYHKFNYGQFQQQQQQKQYHPQQQQPQRQQVGQFSLKLNQISNSNQHRDKFTKIRPVSANPLSLQQKRYPQASKQSLEQHPSATKSNFKNSNTLHLKNSKSQQSNDSSSASNSKESSEFKINDICELVLDSYNISTSDLDNSCFFQKSGKENAEFENHLLKLIKNEQIKQDQQSLNFKKKGIDAEKNELLSKDTATSSINNEQKSIPGLYLERRRTGLEVHDDIELIPQVQDNGRIETQQRTNRILAKLKQVDGSKMNNNSSQCKEIDLHNINLNYEAYKNMYQSYDSGKLTSTIINLDLEEMTHCLGAVLERQIYIFTKENQIKLYGVQADNPLVKPQELKIIEEEDRGETSHQAEIKKKNELEQENALKFNCQDFSSQETSQLSEQQKQGVKYQQQQQQQQKQQYEKIQGQQQEQFSKQERKIVTGQDNQLDLKFKQFYEQKEMVESILQESMFLNGQRSQSSNFSAEITTNNLLNQLDKISNAPNQSKDDYSQVLQNYYCEKDLEEKYSHDSNISSSNASELEQQQQEQQQQEHTKKSDSNSTKHAKAEVVPIDSYNLSLAKRLSERDPYQVEVDISSENSNNNDGESLDMQQQDMGLEDLPDSCSMTFSLLSSYLTSTLAENENEQKRVENMFKVFEEECDSDMQRNVLSEKNFSSYPVQNLPTKEVIQNYSKNIILTSKMEKEVPIIALVYIERLVQASGCGISCKNWKKILLIALILASKIWDDESFENENFAEAFPKYTTKQINEMERVFLQFIDYNLNVKCCQYAKYYFILRTFTEKRKKSFPLRPLNIMTIAQLQNNCERAQKIMKEKYADPLNKSF